jgi:transcriptional regulator with XRE-family HTH domain
MTQVSFAEYIGISYDTYKNWEIGHRNPSGPAIALLYIVETQPNTFKKKRKAIIKKLCKSLIGHFRNTLISMIFQSKESGD